MASSNVTSANTDNNIQANGNRHVLRDNRGLPYVFAENQTDGSIDAWKADLAVDASYYFDTSVSGPRDDEGVWSNDANAFDGSTSTSATITSNMGNVNSKELRGIGTTAPASGSAIYNVRVRMYHQVPSIATAMSTKIFLSGVDLGGTTGNSYLAPAWSNYSLLTTPTGGWTYANLQNLESATWQTLGTAGTYNLYKLEIEVSTLSSPTTWVEVASGTNPVGVVYGSSSACIASDGVASLVYMQDAGKSSTCRSVRFITGTDVWSTDEEVDADIDADPTNINNLWTAIAMDSNDIAHMVYTRYETSMGTNYHTLTYNNRIGGAWNASGIEIEGSSGTVQCLRQGLAIDQNNVPVVAYANETDNDVGTAIGNANDAATFELFDIDTDHETTAGQNRVSICVDSSGDQWVAYRDESDTFIYLRQHVKASAWSTWTARTSSGNNGINPSVGAVGTDIYVFYEEDTASDIAYDVYTGSWAGETIAETGTFNYPFVNWAFNNNFGANSVDYGGISGALEVDYVFADETATTDIWWNTIDLTPTPPVGGALTGFISNNGMMPFIR